MRRISLFIPVKALCFSAFVHSYKPLQKVKDCTIVATCSRIGYYQCPDKFEHCAWVHVHYNEQIINLLWLFRFAFKLSNADSIFIRLSIGRVFDRVVKLILIQHRLLGKLQVRVGWVRISIESASNGFKICVALRLSQFTLTSK